jgi:hypothetical protein
MDRPTGSTDRVPTTSDPVSPGTSEPSVLATYSPEPTQTACVEVEPFVKGSIAWFDGTCYGWLIAPHEVLEAAGLHNRNLQLDCDPRLYGDSLETSGPPAVDHHTDLDIEFSSPPDGEVVHVMKWACGTKGVSDLLTVTLDEGRVSVERALQGTPSVEVEAVDGSVAPCDVLGRPAVCVDYLTADELHANSIAQVIILEDSTLDPHAVVVRLSSEDASLATLLYLAELVVDD